jgi:hypothetical protein
MRVMKAPVATALAAGIVLGAAAIGLLHPWDTAGGGGDHPPATSNPGSGAADPASAFGLNLGASLQESLPADHPPVQGAASPLPPNHPPISGAVSPHDGIGGSIASADEAPAITWDVPTGWKTLPNPNAMRIATYRPASGDSELIAARAGGSTDANIQRWIGQFDEPAQSQRSRRTVHGFRVEVVEIRGTYAGSGMMPGAPSEPHPGWTLLGAVVETPGSHYFFKLIGPSDQVQATHASFDALIASIRPL